MDDLESLTRKELLARCQFWMGRYVSMDVLAQRAIDQQKEVIETFSKLAEDAVLAGQAKLDASFDIRWKLENQVLQLASALDQEHDRVADNVRKASEKASAKRSNEYRKVWKEARRVYPDILKSNGENKQRACAELERYLMNWSAEEPGRQKLTYSTLYAKI